uniref:Uncharacterized protein n=1 Tax=Chromera velia CCMP2878 TaxID=1169474 RepID=A0A0K6S7E5_9ALVE|eukprot:Cvel_554.t2-p1 / transcript=Cvel_554.t2 / gene=Cvel_554 / organism=Chromera_velia_CCMP2878 / gene_product=Putative ankyrin repeat protein RF_0381, putative / transcript_product=Putative ankyrin repeat protein RF_0381, putative / location=Cvel_scaffold17:89903-91376(+) / protein_length=464 / sequence_SO=supercontig / SO=protein_coding / is_pseudo=false
MGSSVDQSLEVLSFLKGLEEVESTLRHFTKSLELKRHTLAAVFKSSSVWEARDGNSGSETSRWPSPQDRAALARLMELLNEFKSFVCTELAQVTGKNYKMDLSSFFNKHTNVAQEISKFQTIEPNTIEKALDSFTETGIGRDFHLLLHVEADVEGMGGGRALGKRILSKAVSQGNMRAMRMLLEDGALVETIAPNGENAAASSKTESLVETAVSTGNLEAVKVLVRAGRKIGPQVFERAVSGQRWRILRYLFKVSRPPHESNEEPRPSPPPGRAENWEGGSLDFLCSAALGPGRVEATTWLVKEGANVHRISQRGVTLLHKAAFWGFVSLIRLLRDRSVDREAVDETGKSVLTYAVRRLQQEVVELLVFLGANVNKTSRNGHVESLTPLHQIGHGGCGFNGALPPSDGHEDQVIAEVLVGWGAEVEAEQMQKGEITTMQLSSTGLVENPNSFCGDPQKITERGK